MNNLSNNLLSEMFSQTSSDPFLMLVTMSHESFASTLYLVNNIEDVTSNGQVYTAFPMKVVLPTDDGTSVREVKLQMDNVSLELIDEIRSVITPIDVKVEMILASTPDTIEMDLGELRIKNITYDGKGISASLYLDDFLNTELPSEKYTPEIYVGIYQ